MKHRYLSTLLVLLVTLLLPVRSYASASLLSLSKGLNVLSSGVAVENYGDSTIVSATGVLPYVYSSASATAAASTQQTKVNLTSYTKVLYVSTIGSDTSGTGTSDNPFNTIQKAVNIAQNGYAIYVREGSYDVTNGNLDTEGDMTGLNNLNKNIDFIGVPGKTILQIKGDTINNRDVHAYSGYGFSNIYDMIFQYNAGTRPNSYQNALFGYGAVQGKIYNSVFAIKGSYAPTLTYNNTSSVLIELHNCAFDTPYNFAQSYTGESYKFVIADSAITKAFSPYGGSTKTNIMSNTAFDSTYHVTNGSNSTIGVYSGAYSW